MSRKWERMVEKNSKMVNKTREKSGHKPITNAGKQGGDIIYGRSILFPSFLVFVALFFVIVYGPYAEKNALFWITLGAYVVLAIIYYLKRPFLKIDKNTLTTRRMGRDRTLTPSDIEGIVLGKKHVSIPLKGKKGSWYFSRTIHRYSMEELESKLRKYAEKHQIPFIREEKKQG